MTRELLQQEWKQGDEYLPYHPQASHVNPDYRDGWNACYEAALAQPEQPAPTWVPLMASDWINILNTASAINAHSDEVVKHAVKLTEARLKTLNSTTQPASDQLEKLQEIIAAVYQIAGAYDAPGHVLDVLETGLKNDRRAR